MKVYILTEYSVKEGSTEILRVYSQRLEAELMLESLNLVLAENSWAAVDVRYNVSEFDVVEKAQVNPPWNYIGEEAFGAPFDEPIPVMEF